LRPGDEKAAADLREIADKREKLSSLTQRAAMDRAESDWNLPRELGAACTAMFRYPEARVAIWLSTAIRSTGTLPASQQRPGR